MLVQDFLISSAGQFPDKSVLIYKDRDITYGQLLRAAYAVAAWLQELDLESGFRGALLTEDPYEYLAGYFGVLMAGGVVVGVNTQTTASSLAYLFNDCDASVLFAGRKYKKLLSRALPDMPSLTALALAGKGSEVFGPSIGQQEDFDRLLLDLPFSVPEKLPFRTSCDYAQIIYTSGTTGKPKGVILRHRNLTTNTQSTVAYLQLTVDDRVMAVLPFFYSYGNSIVLTHIAVGGTLIVNTSFLYPNVILQQMVDHRVTGFSGVPSTFALLLNRSAIDTFRFPDLRYITQAGAAMAPDLATRLTRICPDTEIFIMYGQTEAAPRLAYLPPEDLLRKAGSIGKGIPGVELALLDEQGEEVDTGVIGEIVARGENIMAGYWNRQEETVKVLRPEGLWTGDLARRDDEGYYFIVSRKSDIIKTGAHRIGPKEIEDTISAYAAVHEVAVVGVADEILGERIRACIVLNLGVDCTVKDLKKHCRVNLPAYKVPHEYVFCDELPKTATGKIKKSELRTS